MGIPVYFKTLISDYGDTILHKDTYDDINYLFFDLNCLIHPCARGLSDEEEIIDKILSEIDKLIKYTRVKDLIYIAIDGIAPKMKMRQQRMRRHKSALERKYNTESSWNTNAISPGTHFMKKLNISLKKHIEKYKNIILDDSDNRGEGEHKILNYILNNNLKGKICIYGLDADLIQLSLVSHKPNIVLLRETTDYNIENTKSEYVYLKIDILKNHLVKSFHIQKVVDEKRLIDDYIFMCFLLGNDFMNHIPSLSLRYGGHDTLLDTYSKLQTRYGGYFRLIDRNLNDIIHMTFFKEFISELSSLEDIMINKMKMIRYKQHKKIHSQYYNDFKDLQKFIGESNKEKNKISSKCLSLEDIYRFQYNTNNNKDSVKKMIDNLPILFIQNESYTSDYDSNDSNECEDYMKCLMWTTHYYFNECVNWRFNSEYNHGPFITNLNKFIVKPNNDILLNKDDKEYSNYEQLSYIFPKDSHNLHEYDIYDIIGKEYDLSIDLSYSRYLWECNINFN
jgi:5'-3' exonuclease